MLRLSFKFTSSVSTSSYLVTGTLRTSWYDSKRAELSLSSVNDAHQTSSMASASSIGVWPS